MIGKTLGHYRIVEKIGAGGMGEVYRAHDEQLDRDVAIKVLPASSLGDSAARGRLLGEARAAAALNHPHICIIHEVSQADGQAFIVMEFVEGRTLSALVPSDGLPGEAVIRYGTQVADALGHAHKRGIIHRDLKTANVVVTPQGQAKVLDFGLAAQYQHNLSEVTRSHLSLEEADEMAGTLAYMAPEVLRGERGDARRDIWALGVLLYDMAVGSLPFRGKTGFELSSCILREPPAPLPERVPAGLRAIIQQCLAKHPEQRYEQASEVRAALEALQSDTAVVPRASASTRRSRKAIDSLAVLPFTNSTADPDTEYLSDGITESIINSLTYLRGLRVMARSTVFRYKGRKVDPQTAGSDLNVRAVLTGRILQRGDTLIIGTELVDVTDGSQLWGEQYNRKLSDLLAIQEEIAKEISGKLELRLTGREKKRLAKPYTENTEAYQLYLKGRYYWNKRTAEGVKKGIAYFEQAIDKDPDYALACAGLADSYILLASYGLRPAEEARLRAKAAALKALAIDDTLAEAHTSLAFATLLYDWDWPAAEREFKRAIDLNPAYAPARHWYALYLAAMGRHEEAFAEIKRAQDLDPLSLIINTAAGRVFYLARQYDAAIGQCRKTLELDPNFVQTHFDLGMAYEQKSMFEEATAQFRKAVTLSGGSPVTVAALGHAFAAAGKKAEAMKILGKLKELSKQRYVPAAHLSLFYTGLGEKDEALAWLQKAYEDRSDFLIYLKVHPRLDSLRSDSRFQDLLRRMNFP